MIRHRWLLTVAIAAALVGMHLVTEHRGYAGRFAPAPIIRAAGVGWSLVSPTLTADSPGGPLAVKPVQASLASTAVLASHPCCGVSMAMVGHCCLAVLTTAPPPPALPHACLSRRGLDHGGRNICGQGSAPWRCERRPPVQCDVPSFRVLRRCPSLFYQRRSAK